MSFRDSHQDQWRHGTSHHDVKLHVSEHVDDGSVGTPDHTSAENGIYGGPAVTLKPLDGSSIRLSCREEVVGIVPCVPVIYVCHHSDPRLWIYSSKTRQIIKTCEIPELLYPTGMATLDKNVKKLVIAGSAPNALHFVTLTASRDIKGHWFKRLTFTPRRVSVGNGGAGPQIAVANCSNNTIVLLNTAGDTQRVVDVAGCDIGLMYWALQTPSGYVITDTCNRRLVWTDHEGNAVTCCHGNEKKPFRHPSQALVDSAGNTLLIDRYSNNLQLFSRQGAWQRCLLSRADGLQNPDCMHLDETCGLLYLAHGGDSGKLIQTFHYSARS